MADKDVVVGNIVALSGPRSPVFPSDSNIIDFEVRSNLADTNFQQATPEEIFYAHLCNFAQIGLATAKAKNQDYAGNGDPFANFRNAEKVGVSTPRGILVRMMDKVARISNLIDRPPSVANESLVDSCIDMAMYSLILATYFEMHPKGDK